MVDYATIQVKRGTSAEWAANDLVLAPGEPGLNTTTGVTLYGDGVTKYSQLPSRPSLTQGNIWRGSQTFGPTIAPRARQPWMSSQVVRATDAGTEDHVSHLLETRVRGDWTNDTGFNPSFAWGANIFTATGNAAGDANGLQNLVGALIEADVAAPAGTAIKNVTGLFAEASFFGSASGATVENLKSFQVNAPVRKDGATAGTATFVYGMYMQKVTAEAVGATTAYTLFVAGGRSRFMEQVEIVANFATDALLNLRMHATQSVDPFRINKSDGSTRAARITSSGAFTSIDRIVARENLPSAITLGDVGPAQQAGVSFGNTTPGLLFLDGGALKWRSPAGAITTLVVA